MQTHTGHKDTLALRRKGNPTSTFGTERSLQTLASHKGHRIPRRKGSAANTLRANGIIPGTKNGSMRNPLSAIIGPSVRKNLI